MKALKIFLGIFLALYIIVPLYLNSHNIHVNKKDITLFTSRYILTQHQIRQKDILFIDGRLDGFKTKPIFLQGGIYYEIRLECRHNPEKTSLRIRFLEKKGENNYLETGNLSFIGSVKDGLLKKGIANKVLAHISNMYTEDIASIEAFNALIKGAE